VNLTDSGQEIVSRNLFVMNNTVIILVDLVCKKVAYAPLCVLYFYFLPIGANRRGVEREWGEIAGETRAWEAVQGSLDVYVQRISVADAQQKAHMRAWYESLQEIGGLYYGNNFMMQ
jgi:hypothetical protein